MRITKRQLRRIIKEERIELLREAGLAGAVVGIGGTLAQAGTDLATGAVSSAITDDPSGSTVGDDVEKLKKVAKDSPITAGELEDILSSVSDELEATCESLQEGYIQYSQDKFLEVLGNVDKQIMELRSGNPFTYSAAKTPFYRIRVAINDIRKAAELEMKNENY